MRAGGNRNDAALSRRYVHIVVLDWDHVTDVLARWELPAGCDLHLDAVALLESNSARLQELLRR